MPKDRRVNSSFDRATVSPYSCSSKISDLNNPETSSPNVGDEREWEEARCPICMEHPHNAVLLLCSSRDKGCRPFICDTSYRHSNCLDQFRKSSSPSEEQESPLLCPLCRGLVTGFDVVQPARKFMNAKSRSCSLETCNFNGNYGELRKHARTDHPSERPSEASPTRQSNWTILEQQREIEDALAHQSDIEYDWEGWPNWDEWVDDDLWSDGSFFDFPSGMSDIDDDLVDEMFSGLSLSFFSLYSSPHEEEMIMMDSGNSSSNLDQRSPLPILRSRLNYRHTENDATISRSRSSYRRETGSTSSRSRSSYHRENDAPQSSRTRPSYNRDYSHRHRDYAPLPISRGRSSYNDRRDESYNGRRDERSVRRSGSGHLHGSSRQRRSDFGLRED